MSCFVQEKRDKQTYVYLNKMVQAPSWIMTEQIVACLFTKELMLQEWGLFLSPTPEVQFGTLETKASIGKFMPRKCKLWEVTNAKTP